MSVTADGPLPEVPASEAACRPQPRARGSGFWAVAFAFLVVMAVATLPSPLYGLYRTRDHLSALTITVVFAIFAGSTIGVLQWDSSIAARLGRRGMMLAAVATMMLAMAVLAAWKDLPGLLIGRLVTGVSVGLAAGISITYLVELRLRADPKASVVRARTIGTSVTIGALGVGPLIAGCLAQWVAQPLTVPYLVFVALGVVALAGLWDAPRRGAGRGRGRRDQLAGSRRKVRLPIPAAAETLAAFAANGLFAALSGLILATTMHQCLARTVRCRALPGFRRRGGVPAGNGQAAGIAGARTGNDLHARGPGAARCFRAPRHPEPGAVPNRGRADRRGFRSCLQGDVRDRAGGEPAGRPRSDDIRSAHRALRRIAVPVIGAGIALDLGASPPNTVLGFAVLVGLGVVVSAGHC